MRCFYCSSDQLSSQMKNAVLSSFPHYGHAGIVESARELYTVLEGQPIHQGQQENMHFSLLRVEHATLSLDISFSYFLLLNLKVLVG